VTYIAIDGDDIGRRITNCYLTNDSEGLTLFANKVQKSVVLISELLRKRGYTVIFCAADGVVGRADVSIRDVNSIYKAIEEIGGAELTFSAGVGETLRESYVALLSAKISGKARMCIYGEMD
jgi:hypothetical protein